MQTTPERTPLRIAFGCKARSGKDTAADYLISKYGGVKLSFAKAVYDIANYAQTRCGFEIEKDRALLQTIGTWARSKNEDTWVNILLKDIKRQETRVPIPNIFVTDVRYPNEFEALKKAGFVMIRVDRHDAPVLGEALAKHASETSLDNFENSRWNHVLPNKGTLKEFFGILDRTVNWLKHKQVLYLDEIVSRWGVWVDNLTCQREEQLKKECEAFGLKFIGQEYTFPRRYVIEGQQSNVSKLYGQLGWIGRITLINPETNMGSVVWI